MNKKVIIILAWISCFFLSKSHAQLYAEQRSQHRFAQTYLGLDFQMTPSSGQLFWQEETYAFPAMNTPRLIIGGLHFWGKVDFRMNFPLASWGQLELPENGEIRLRTGGDLSARYYPYRILYGKLRPFVGVSFHQMTMQLGSSTVGSRYDIFISTSLLTGLSFASKGWQLNAEVAFLARNKRDFYSRTNQLRVFRLPRSQFSLGLVKYFDVTLKEETPKLSGKTQRLTEELAKTNQLNSFSLAVAPSSSFFLRSPHFEGPWVSLPTHKANFNWEFSLGYFWHRANLHVDLSYRAYTSNVISYSLEHIIKREALSFEIFKFFGDYNGFVPFAGLSLSAERWATGLFVDDVQRGPTNKTRLFSPGVIFGWDILASPLETWILRTNLRYYPWQRINDFTGQKESVDQFEFNFIQVVIYPNRMRNIPRARKRSSL